jgi:hypothetical protein
MGHVEKSPAGGCEFAVVFLIRLLAAGLDETTVKSKVPQLKLNNRMGVCWPCIVLKGNGKAGSRQ